MTGTPLTATRRITISYTVVSLPHKHHAYARPGIDILGVPQVLARDGISPLDWKVAAQGSWDAIRWYLDGDVSAATALLEDFLSGVWIPVDSATLTGAGRATAALSRVASQLTVVVRTDDFAKIRWIALEGDSGFIGHSATGLGINSDIDALMVYLKSTTNGVGSPWNWQVSRGNRIFHASNPITGATLDLNDKLKRARGKE